MDFEKRNELRGRIERGEPTPGAEVLSLLEMVDEYEGALETIAEMRPHAAEMLAAGEAAAVLKTCAREG